MLVRKKREKPARRQEERIGIAVGRRERERL
jgi:hypothetical protein